MLAAVELDGGLEEDADALGLSILSGAHMTLAPRVIELLHDQGIDDVAITVGGTISAEDIGSHRQTATTRRSNSCWRISGRRPAAAGNVMPLLLDAARVPVSEGEIVEALQQVWGDYREQPVF